MKIDTGQHLPIKLQAYRAPLHKREIIEKAVDEMLSANIIVNLDHHGVFL
jgi:hypothetical protein